MNEWTRKEAKIFFKVFFFYYTLIERRPTFWISLVGEKNHEIVRVIFNVFLLSYFGEPGLCDPGRTYCDDYLTFTVEKHKSTTEMARQFAAQLSLFIYFHIVGIVLLLPCV